MNNNKALIEDLKSRIGSETRNNNKALIEDLKSRIGSETSPKQKLPSQMANDIHSLNMKNATQIRWLRWILVAVILAIALAHLGILYYFLDKAGNENIKTYHYFLSDKVLMTFLSTTTADVFALLFIIARFLFPISKTK
ncbi:MAG: hypothetical protein K0R14_771 [Burkholderiales bacterium]|jgi:hypothetical protein|nr:hypothetical protein [Burkholderiales bacterium]